MTDIVTVNVILRDIRAALFAVTDESAHEADLIASKATGFDIAYLHTHGDAAVPADSVRHALDMVCERRTGRPLQYILGEWEFMGLVFRVDERALIPRQDTETLVETAIAMAAQGGFKTALDMCCGTGCIGISLMKLAGLDCRFADISAGALALTEENLRLNEISADGRAIYSDGFLNIDGRYDMILCNPPYLTGADMDALQRELRHEPALALFGGDDGLDFYRRIAREYPEHMNDGGALIMECGAGQAEAVIDIFRKGETVCDLCGKKRVIVIKG